MEIAILILIPIFFLVVLLLVFIALVLLYTFVSRFAVQSSGWAKLAELYPADDQPEGQVYKQRTVQVGAVRYRFSTTVCINRQGLYLSVRLPDHSPIFIPWDEIKRIRKTRIYWRRAMQLSVGDPQVTTVAVWMNLFRVIQPHLNPDIPG